MLKLLKRTPIMDSRPAPVRSLHDRADLRIRPLLQDPALRRSMGLEPLAHGASTWEPPVPTARVEAPFNLRRLLRNAAA